jgi:phage terminase large subunit-like protein
VGAIVDALALIGNRRASRASCQTIKTAERKLADGSLRHGDQGLMAWAVANARVEPKGNAILITKQVSAPRRSIR